MLRDPRPVQTSARPATEPRTQRFQITKLEERIAPKCSYNPQGKQVGNCPYKS